MKKTFVALALGLISNAALASGPINFVGTVTAGGTCQIDLVGPGTGGPVLSRLVMGNHRPEHFTAIGTKTSPIPFAMRITPGSGCIIGAGESGYLTFDPIYGPVGTDLYGLRPAGALGLALAIQDKSLTNLAPGTESEGYLLDENNPTNMHFYAMYESTAAVVTPGEAVTEVGFTFAHK